MSTLTISAGAAAELYELEDGDAVGEWTRIADQKGSSGRWLERHWLVITKGEGCFGIPYALGLTEEQENEFPWAASSETTPDAVVLTPLVGVTVTTTKFLTEEQYKRHLAKTGGTDG